MKRRTLYVKKSKKPCLALSDSTITESSSSETTYSQEEDEVEEATTADAFFDRQVPFIFNTENDAYLLASNRNDEMSYIDRVLSAERARRNTTSRDIRTFWSGDIVHKNCEPWGEMNVLNNDAFIVVNKIFRADGDIAFVHLKSSSSTRDYYIDAPFFSGWTSDVS